jgi:hypothetical protein
VRGVLGVKMLGIIGLILLMAAAVDPLVIVVEGVSLASPAPHWKQRFAAPVLRGIDPRSTLPEGE